MNQDKKNEKMKEGHSLDTIFQITERSSGPFRPSPGQWGCGWGGGSTLTTLNATRLFLFLFTGHKYQSWRVGAPASPRSSPPGTHLVFRLPFKFLLPVSLVTLRFSTSFILFFCLTNETEIIKYWPP